MKKKVKYTLVIGASLYVGLHFSLPKDCTLKQVRSYISNNIENVIYADDEVCTDYLNGKDLSLSDRLDVNKRKVIKVDLCSVQNLSHIPELENIETLEISNAQRLSDSDFDILNSLSIDELYLNFNLEEMIRNNNKFDFNRINNKKIIENISFHNVKKIDEYYGVLILNYFKNINDIKCLDLSKYEDIDTNINKIISSINYSMSDDEFDIILKNLSFVTEHIEYDKFVSDIIGFHSNLSRISKKDKDYYYDNIDKKNEVSSDYNVHSLSAVTCELDRVNKGICINYSSLLSILCIKKGIPVFRATGDFNKDGHAWNLYYPKDFNKPVYIDPTFLDSDKELYNTIKEYLDDKTISQCIDLYNKIYLDIKENSSYHINTKLVDYYNDVIFNNNYIIGTQFELNKWLWGFKTFLILALYSIISYAIKLAKQLGKISKDTKYVDRLIRKFFFEQEEIEESEIDIKTLKLNKVN